MKALYYFAFITGWPVGVLYYRSKVYYENKKIQSKKIKGPMIIVSNHTSLLDWPAIVYAFFGRYIRPIGSEMLFRKKGNAWFFKNIGIIRSERFVDNYSFLNVAKDFLLEKKGVIAIYPEAKLPKEEERENGIRFTHGATYLALDTNVPILPVFVLDTKNFKKRTKIVVGTPFMANDYYDESLTREENISNITQVLRDKVFRLRDIIDGKNKEN